MVKDVFELIARIWQEDTGEWFYAVSVDGEETDYGNVDSVDEARQEVKEAIERINQ